jgi:hypothetical protein
MNNTNSREAILTRREAADYLRVCLSVFDKLGVPRIRLRRKVLFRREALDKWLAENETAGICPMGDVLAIRLSADGGNGRARFKDEEAGT